MKNTAKQITVKVTGKNAILKEGSVAQVQDTGHGFWVVLTSNGVKISPSATVFLIEGRDFQSA